MLKGSDSLHLDNPDIADTRGAWGRSSEHHIKIGVVENDILLCEGLVALLNSVEEFDCIGAWSQAQEALIALHAQRPDVLLLDIRQLQPFSLAPFMLTPSIRAKMRVLLMMNCPEERRINLNAQALPSPRGASTLLPAWPLGVCGIVCKERGFRKIAESIRQVYDGEHGNDPATVAHTKEPCLCSHRLDAPTENAQAENLTLRERQVIQLIGQGHSNKDIAREMQLGYSTVKNYVSSVLKKLQLEGRTQIVLFAHQAGEELRLPLQWEMK